jgi:hypothetical protein
MKRAFAIIVIFSAMALLASQAQAGRKERSYVVRQEWDQKVYDPRTGQWAPVYQDRSVRLKNGERIRPDEKISASDGRDYRLVPVDGQDQEVYRKPDQPAIVEGTKRIPADLSHDSGRVVGGQKSPPPPKKEESTIPYTIKEGEIIDRDIATRFTTRRSTGKILKASKLTPDEAKKLRPGDVIKIPEKEAKEKYQQPFDKIDKLTAEKEQLQLQIAAMEEVSSTKDASISKMRALLEEKDKEIQELKNKKISESAQDPTVKESDPEVQQKYSPAKAGGKGSFISL